MRDDGLAGDAIAGDGIYSATISGRAANTVVAFRIEATDAAGPAVSKVFPPEAPAQECLIRWGDPVPFGTLAHYHLWNTQATKAPAPPSTTPSATRARLWQLARDLQRRLPRQGQSVSRRRRGLRGDGAAGRSAARRRSRVRVHTTAVLKPRLSRNLLGVDRSTAWHPALHGYFMLLYRNGGLFRNIMEDLEQPTTHAEQWFQRAAKAILQGRYLVRVRG